MDTPVTCQATPEPTQFAGSGTPSRWASESLFPATCSGHTQVHSVL